MNIKRKLRGPSRWLIYASVGVMVGTGLVVPEASAGSRGGGSVKHSSKKSSGPGKSSARSPGRGSPGGVTPGRGTPGRSPGVSPGARRSHRSRGRYSARGNARRDYRRFMAITGLIHIGVYYATRPRYSTTIVVTGTSYYYSGGVYYAHSGSGYVVVQAPPTAVVYAVPTATTIVYVGSAPYYYYGGTYYIATDKPAEQPPPSMSDEPDENDIEQEMTDDEHNYEVVEPPIGATVPYLPDEADEETIGGMTYMLYEGTYYRPFISEGETIYLVVEDPHGSGSL